MIVMSLFDGMSCARIVLNKMGIQPEKYYAAEIDKFAVAESKANWPDIKHMGDVTNWKEWPIDWASIDLLVGGSPCQGFSFAGKKLAFNDPRSKLFFVYVDILNHIKSVNPNVKFMLENVKMKKEYLNVITDRLEVSPIFINSAKLSAQNRQRYYWSNWDIDQPENRGIVLSDIIESGAVDRDKSHFLDANYFKGGNLRSYFEKNRRQLVFNPAAIVGRKINPETGKRADNNPDIKLQQYLEVHEHGKARCLSTVLKDCLVSSAVPGRYLIMKPRGNNKGGVRALDGKTPSMTACSWQENFKLTDGKSYRKLTVTECCRLQGVPDDYFKVSSNTQAYKMLGNGWQCDTIEHIFRCANFNSVNRVNDAIEQPKQAGVFDAIH